MINYFYKYYNNIIYLFLNVSNTVDPNNLCQNDTSNDHDDENPELGIENLLGIFLVLIIGCILGVFIGFLEFIWNVKKIAIEEKVY